MTATLNATTPWKPASGGDGSSVSSASFYRFATDGFLRGGRVSTGKLGILLELLRVFILSGKTAGARTVGSRLSILKGRIHPAEGETSRRTETMTLATAACALSLPTVPSAGPIGYERFKSGNATYHAVMADLSSGQVHAETVHANGLTSVWKMIGRTQPVAAITGTFFSPSSHRPVADLLVNGKLVSRGSIGTAIGFGWYGDVTIFDVPNRAAADWGEYRFGLRGGVRVVKSGKVQPDPKAQRFKDRRIWGRAARTGIGLTRLGKLVLVATSQGVTLSELGQAMRSKGVVDGVSLDGGGSTCLYYQGWLVVPPKRLLNNLVVLHRSSGIASLPPPASSARDSDVSALRRIKP